MGNREGEIKRDTEEDVKTSPEEGQDAHDESPDEHHEVDAAEVSRQVGALLGKDATDLINKMRGVTAPGGESDALTFGPIAGDTGAKGKPTANSGEKSQISGDTSKISPTASATAGDAPPSTPAAATVAGDTRGAASAAEAPTDMPPAGPLPPSANAVFELRAVAGAAAAAANNGQGDVRIAAPNAAVGGDAPAPIKDAGDKPAAVKDAGDKPVAAPVKLTEQDQITQQIQNILVMKMETNQLQIPGKDGDSAKQLLEQLKKELRGEGNDGHPQWGPVSQEVFKAYKTYIENQGVKSAMGDLANMQLGTATRSPEQLRLVNQYGQLLPEQPIDFVNRMRRGQMDWQLRTLDDKGKPADIKLDKPPSQDVLDRIRGAESFVKWAQDEVIFDRKVRLQEHRLEERIKKEGWPKEWLESPMKEKDRYGWCRAVMQRLEESNRVSRMLEAIYDLRAKPGMEHFGDEALKKMPAHVKATIEKGADDKEHVKSVKLEHPKDLDFQNPDWNDKRKAEQDWLKANAREVGQALNAKEFKDASPNNFLFQGDIETKGLAVALDNKTGEVLSTFKKEDWDDPAKRAKLLPPGKSENDVNVQDFNIIQCRLEVGQTRGENGEVKEVTVQFNSQYGDAPGINYHNLIVNPVGKPANPSAPEWADGKLHFKPNAWVVARSANGEEMPMKAKDLEDYKEWEDFKRYSEIAVSAVMDASMVLGGVGAIGEGIQAIRGAGAMYKALRAAEEGMQLMRTAGITEGVIERAGARMLLKGGLEVGLGVTGAVRNDEVQQVRSVYFLSQAFAGLPGLNKATGGIGKLVGLGKDAERLHAAQELLGIKPGAFSKLMEGAAEKGFKWSNRAFGLQMIGHMQAQRDLIESIGKPDGMRLAEERLRGVRMQDKPLTPAQEREKQEQYLRTVDKMLNDYLKNQNVEHKEDVQKILDKTKGLLEPPPKELVGPPPKEKELKEFADKRKQEVQNYLKDLRENFLFDPQRIADAEKQRAERQQVSGASDWQKKIKDHPVLVESISMEKDRVDKAQKAMDDKKAEVKKAGEPKDKNEARQRDEDMLKLRLQLENAQQQLKEAEEEARQQLRTLEKDDPAVKGTTPERKFQDKDDVRKAAALAYLLLSTNRDGDLPKDGVLHKEQITVPEWSVTKSWTEGSGEDAHTVTETHKNAARKVEQQLKVEDLAALLTPDLSSTDPAGKDNPSGRRLNTADFLDRLGVISPEAHASTVKRVLQDSNTSVAEKNIAICELGALIKQIQFDEAKRATGMPVVQRFVEAGERYGNTSEDLRKVLADTARNPAENKDVRAFASYYSNYVIDRKTGRFDAADMDFLRKAIDKTPPGLSYDDFMKYMVPRAGITAGDQPGIIPGDRDLAGWDRRLRAAQALEQFIDPKTGRAEAGFTRQDINNRIAEALDPSRPDITIHAAKSLLEKVAQPDGTVKSRLDMLDRDNPDLALKSRENLLKVLQAGRLTGEPAKDYAIRAAAMDFLPDMMRGSKDLPGPQKARLDQLRKDSADTLRSTLYVTSEQEVLDLRRELAAARRANAKPEQIKAIQDKFDVAVSEFSTLNGYSKKLTSDQAYMLVLQHSLAMMQDGNPNKANVQKAFDAMKATTTLAAPDKPNLVGLNNAAFGDESMRYGAIQALAKMGAGDPETVRVLRERATPPKDETDNSPRVEPDPEARMAAVRAMQQVMTPYDFARECNSLVLKERNPAIATLLRENSFYSDIALDPSTPQYQNRMAQAREWIDIGENGKIKGIEDEGSIFNRAILKDDNHPNPPYGWLNGQDLISKMIAAKDSVYGGYWPGIKQLACAWDNGTFDMNWAPGTPPPMRWDGNKKELNALTTAIRKYNDDVQSKILDVATSTGAGDQDHNKRLEAQKLCYALAMGKLDAGFQSDDRIASAGQTREQKNLGAEMAQGLRIKAAKALVEACQPGMPDRATAGKYLMDALKRADDPLVRRYLLDGANNLTTTKYKEGDRTKEDRTLAPAAPLIANQIFLALQDSLGKDSPDTKRAGHKRMFESECVEFIRRHSSPDEMRELLPKLDGVAKAQNTPSPVRQQLLDVVASKRDRIAPVWNAAPEDSVNRDPAYRKTLLDQALKESRPGAQGNGADAEARVPSAVGKIAIAAKGDNFDKTDPRVPALVELLGKGEGEKPRDERVRVAAAYALLRQTKDENLHTEAVKTLVDVAVNGNRPGTRHDAKSIINSLGGSYAAMLEKSLRETTAGEPEQGLKDAQRLSLLGQVLAKQGKNLEAEQVLTAAINGFRDKEKDAPLKDVFDYGISKNFGKYLAPEQSERLRDVTAALTAYSKIKEQAGQYGPIHMTERLRIEGFGQAHPEVIAGQKHLGDLTMARAMQTERDERFDKLEEAIGHYEYALRGMNKGVPVSARDRTQLLDRMGEALLESSKLERPFRMYIGNSAPSMRSRASDLNYAQNIIQGSLKIKERPESGFRPADVAKSHMDLALVHEQRGRLEPAQSAVHKRNAESEINRAIQIAQAQQKDNPIALADTLKRSSEYYKRNGDKATADKYEKESMAIYDKALGHGSLRGKSVEDIDKMVKEFKSKLGENHPLVGKLLTDTSDALRRDGNFPEAEKRAAEAVKICEKNPPINEELYKQALLSQGIATIQQGATAYDRLVEPYEKVRPILEKEADGKSTKSLQACYKNLYMGYYTQAMNAAKAGDFAKATEAMVKSSEYNKKQDPKGQLDSSGKNTLSNVANQLEIKAAEASKTNDYKTIEAALLPALRMRQEANDGKLPDNINRIYGQYSKYLEGRVATEIKNFKDSGKCKDIATPLRLWCELERRKNGGTLPDETEGKLRTVLNELATKENAIVEAAGGEVNADTAKKIQPSEEALLETRKQLYLRYQDRLKKEPDKDEYKEILDQLSNGMAGGGRTLAELSAKTGQTRESAKVLESAYQVLAKDKSVFASGVFQDLIAIHAKQGNMQEVKQLVQNNITQLLDGDSSAAADLIQRGSQIETERKQPGLSASVTEATLAGLEQWLNKQSADKKAEFLKESTPRLVEALASASEGIRDYITDGDGKELPPAEKAQFEESRKKLDAHKHSMAVAAERALRDEVAKSPNEKNLYALLSVLSQDGRATEAAEAAEKFVADGLKTGKLENPAEMLSVFQGAFGQDRVGNAQMMAKVMQLIEQHTASLAKDKATEFITNVYPALLSSGTQATDMVANLPADDPSRKALAERMKTLYEQGEPVFKQQLEKTTDEQKSQEFYDGLMNCYLSQGKTTEARALLKSGVDKALDKGDLNAAAGMIDRAYQQGDKSRPLAGSMVEAVDAIQKKALALPNKGTAASILQQLSYACSRMSSDNAAERQALEKRAEELRKAAESLQAAAAKTNE